MVFEEASYRKRCGLFHHHFHLFSSVNHKGTETGTIKKQEQEPQRSRNRNHKPGTKKPGRTEMDFGQEMVTESFSESFSLVGFRSVTFSLQ